MRMAHHKEILDGFNFQNSDVYWEIRRLLERRPQTVFSDGLSKEARMVMNEMKEESLSRSSAEIKLESSAPTTGDRRQSNLKSRSNKPKANDARSKNHVTYSDSIRKSSLRLERDITDPNFDETKQRKRSLCGGPVQSALETIEIIDACNPTVNSDDDFAIEETAKHNSVEKCIVWMEVNENENEGQVGSVHVPAE